jgi:outer membrane biosynthesis protein TonB
MDIAGTVFTTPVDSNRLTLAKATYDMRLTAKPEGASSRKALMPAAPPIAPAPAGGYSALREKLRRAATEFKPEEGEQSLSGTVQLRLTIGADGKIEQTKVLHGLRADYDEEAQRLVCEGPGWIPGISGGRRATQTVDVTVPF